MGFDINRPFDGAKKEIKRAVNNVTREVNNVSNQVTGAVNNVSNQVTRTVSDTVKQAASGVQTVGNQIKTGAKQIGRNIERSAGNTLKGVALLATGKFDNAGRTLLDAGLTTATGGAYAAINPDDVNKATGTTPAYDRAVKDAQTKADDDAAAQKLTDAAAERAKQLEDVNSTIAGIMGAQKRAPGKRSTLFTGGGTGLNNTLLTYGG